MEKIEVFNEINPLFKQSLQTWYITNILPALSQAGAIIVSLGKNEKLIEEFGYWWAEYAKNSVILFEMMLVDKYSNQSAFTMRVIMEIAADALFISGNKNNLDEFRKYYVLNPERIKNCSYRDFIKLSDKLILRDSLTGKKVVTTGRIKMVYGSDGLDYYKYLCCYTHLNYLGVIKDIDTSISKEGEMDFRLEFIKYYPNTFTAMIRAAEKFSEENDLFEKIDIKKMKEAISELITHHSLGGIE